MPLQTISLAPSGLPMVATQRLPRDEEHSSTVVYTPSASSPSYSETRFASLRSPTTVTTPISPTYSDIREMVDNSPRRHSLDSYSHDSGSNATSPVSTPGSDTSHGNDQFYSRSPVDLDHTLPMSGTTVLKLEPNDEDFKIPSVAASPVSHQRASPAISSKLAKEKPAARKRGRPKKETTASSSTTPPKPLAGTRSKTGCRTCRRRKKKCDETKPHCMCCQKNNIKCEGYNEPTIWQGGKNRKSSQAKSIQWSPLIPGLEGNHDRLMLDHFDRHICDSLIPRTGNMLRDIIVPMARNHEGLMHALLCLSGSDMLSMSHDEWLRQSTEKHREHALAILMKNQHDVPDDATVAQMILMSQNSLLQADVVRGYGEYMRTIRVSLQCRASLPVHESSNLDFQKFLHEYCRSHEIEDCVTSLVRPEPRSTPYLELPEYMLQPAAGSLLGFLDPMFNFISKIRQLRDEARARKSKGQPFPTALQQSQASELDNELMRWQSPHPAGSSAHTASILYKLATWIYLWRTVYESRSHPRLTTVLNLALDNLRSLESDGPIHGTLLMPLFLMGCAAFDPEQRPEISNAFETLRKFDPLQRNRHAEDIVHKVWEAMDAGDMDSSWDWEKIMAESGWDFSLTVQ